jgi:uncharacterized protein YbcV (DUF1398 family)
VDMFLVSVNCEYFIALCLSKEMSQNFYYLLVCNIEKLQHTALHRVLYKTVDTFQPHYLNP